ncbi:MAG TPA: HAD-IIIC family phosphatase [Bryobacteraceae bacterium]|nr:HAD-IIIC family phosphatase [Bryobacteraceae bacterium]
MQLGEALRIIGRTGSEGTRSVYLLCGFTPLHFETFLKAHLALRFPKSAIRIRTGLYGDLEGNLQRAGKEAADGAVVAIEWSDLDARLGFRASAGWSQQTLDDIAVQVAGKCERLAGSLAGLADVMPVALTGPTIGIPHLTSAPPSQANAVELEINAILAQFLKKIADHRNIRLLSANALAMASPFAARHDIKMDLLTGFPWTPAHADTVAEISVGCLFPVEAKKGIITDLDQTLWKGILGDDGVRGISWSLEEKSQIHALYQQTLTSLADAGVLVAIASKNDPALVREALKRPDILVCDARIFPIEASWGLKSDAVGRILQAWNVGEDAVVFVDDSPMELAEVAEKYPRMECIPFPAGDPAAAATLLGTLRARFGRREIREEDKLRLQSLRAAADFREQGSGEDSSDFLARLDARITFEAAGSDKRAFELVNKTNQFNLNGARYTESDWQSIVNRPGGFLANVSYEDRFGPLGKIAVVGGHCEGAECIVDIWVMSCRAFSRQIEFQTVKKLLEKTGAQGIRFGYNATERNGPVKDFLTHFFNGTAASGELYLRAEDFDRLCPPLFHQVNDQWTVSPKN